MFATHRSILLVFLCAATGCEPSTTRKYDPVEDFKDFKIQLDHNMEHRSRPMKITSVTLDELTEVSDEVVRLNYSATAKYFRDSYVEVNRSKVLAKAGWKEAEIQAASRRLRQLPPEDAAAAEAINPSAMLPEQFYRSEGRPGDERNFRGHCTARRRATKWAYESWSMEIDDDRLAGVDKSYDVGVALLQTLPPKSMVWNDDNGKAKIASAVQNMNAFLLAVDAAELKVAEREKRQTELLKSVCEVGKSWTYRDEKSNTAWALDFVAFNADGGEIRVLARHPTDENRRRMYEGAIVKASVEDLGPYLRPVRHPPRVDLRHGGGGPSLFADGEEKLRIQVDSDLATTRLFTNLQNGPIVAAKGRETLSEDLMWKELLARTEPGTQWNGSVTTSRGTSESVTFTVTDRKDDGSYMRVVAESNSDPFTLIVFEGTFEQRFIHGWPIVLRSTQSAIGETQLYNFFRHEEHLPTVSLSLHRQGFVGMRGTDKIFLTSTRKLSPWQPRAKLIEQLFAEGARFSGRMETEMEAVEVVLTFAEIRNEGDYIRVIVQELNEPQELAIYEGRVRREPEFADGYCVELVKRQSGTKREQLFDQYIGTMLGLRLALDNSAILGIVRRPEAKILESMRLTRLDSKSEVVSLTTSDFSTLIRNKLAKGAFWRGTLKDVANNRSTEMTLRVVEQEGDGIKLELSSTQSGGGRAIYDGIFRLDDVSVNGYSVTLHKTEGAKIPTNPRALAAYQTALLKVPKLDIFDEVTGKERTLRLALSYDGETLLGIAGTNASVRENTGELVSLRQTSTANGSPKLIRAVAKPQIAELSKGKFHTLNDGASVVAAAGPSSGVAAPSSSSTTAVPGAGASSPPSGASMQSVIRIWKTSDGKFSVAATFQSLRDGTVTLKRVDGEVVPVPLKILSTADQEFATRAGNSQ